MRSAILGIVSVGVVCMFSPACSSDESCPDPSKCGGVTVVTPDAGQPDAAVDPACANAPKGLFSSKPPCADVSTVTINGATQYTCKCGQPCPCNFSCGSIALAQGGTISNVCAPR